jgi:hypothetical protein
LRVHFTLMPVCMISKVTYTILMIAIFVKVSFDVCLILRRKILTEPVNNYVSQIKYNSKQADYCTKAQLCLDSV